MIQNCYFFMAQDRYFQNEKIKELKNKFLNGQDDDLMNYVRLMKKEATIENIKKECEVYPFLADYKIVHVRNCELFKKSATKESDNFLEFIKTLPSTTILIFDQDEEFVDKKNKFYKTLSKDANFEMFEALKDIRSANQLIDLLSNMANERGVKISTSVLNYFLECMSLDVTHIINEFEKLLSYKSVIKKEDVDAISTKSLNKNIFDMFNYITSKDAGNALIIIKKLIMEKNNESQIMATINTQIKTLYKIKYLLVDAKKRRVYSGTGNISTKLKNEIASKASVNPYVISKMIDQCNNFSLKQLSYLMEKRSEADENLKLGVMSPDVCLQLLVHEIVNVQ